MAIGLLVGAWLLPGPRHLYGVVLDVHTLLYSTAAFTLGFQSAIFAVFTKVFAITEGLLPEDPRLEKAFRYITLESGILYRLVLFLLRSGGFRLGGAFVGCPAIRRSRYHHHAAPRHSFGTFPHHRCADHLFQLLPQRSWTQTAMTHTGELFDHYTETYGTVLETALASTGEGQEYSARNRVALLAKLLQSLRHTSHRTLDFGCGTGTTTPHILEYLAAINWLAWDVSRESVDTANRRFASDRARFCDLDSHTPDGTFNLAYCNGVFHHIPPSQRERSASHVFDSLHAGGIFALWENNPWNPGTRYVMSHCEFDGDAIPLTPPEVRRLLRKVGFEIIPDGLPVYLSRFSESPSFHRELGHAIAPGRAIRGSREKTWLSFRPAQFATEPVRSCSTSPRARPALLSLTCEISVQAGPGARSLEPSH